MVRALTFALALSIVFGSMARARADGVTVKVAAASDLALAFRELGIAFERDTKNKVSFSFGSTGLLAKQIGEGAPYDVFASAKESFVDELTKKGACVADSKAMYARGRIVAWTRPGAPYTVRALGDVTDPRIRRIAIANPEHAPYGQAAREALQKLSLWDAVKSKLVYGENVRQALQFAQTGNADVAIIALSLASTNGGVSLPIDLSLHAAIDQAVVVCGKDPARVAAARAFIAYINGPAGRDVMRRFGFLLPGESVAKSK